MSTQAIFLVVGALLVGMALQAALTARHVVRLLIALNILGSAVFLVFVSLARRTTPHDPVPHAMVLTGIVVAVGATGLGASLLRKRSQQQRSGQQGEG